MPFLPARTLLADAVISGAAVRADAVGGDPARITTAADILRENGGAYNGVVFDVDGVHYWTADFSSGASLVKRRIDTGAAAQTVTITGAGIMGIARWVDAVGAGYVIVACFSTKKVAEVRMVDGVVERLSPVLANAPVFVCKVPGVVDEVVVGDGYNDNAVVRKISMVTGAILGTAASGGSSHLAAASNVAGELIISSNVIVSRLRYSDLVVLEQASLNWTTLLDGAPGTTGAASTVVQIAVIRSMALGPNNSVYIQHTDGSVDRLDSYNPTPTLATWTRMRWMDPDRDGSSYPQLQGYRWFPFLDFSLDGKWLVECVAEGGVTQSVKWHRFSRIDYGVADFTFEILSGGEVTVDTFAVPGNLGNSTGRPSARQRSERATMRWDDRRTLLSYSIDGGSSWVAVGNGEKVLSGGDPVTCPAGVNPKLRAVLKPPSWGRPAAPRPWIAAADGLAGPSLWYEDLSANVYVPVQTATVRGALLQQPMLRGRMAP